MTNADCIRRMNDEQLYDFLSEWECGDIDYSVTFCDLCNEATKRGEVGNVLNLDCDGCRKHWLQRDAVDYGGLMYWKRNTTFEADTPQEERSEQMTLEEAIRHAEQIADSYKDTEPNCKCAEEHRQLAEWLKELKAYRQTDCPWK